MKYKEWKEKYYIKHKDGSRGCLEPLPMGEGVIGISKFIHWYRFHRKDVCEYHD